jgi:hypothetical protein
VSLLGDAQSSLGDAKSSLGDGKSSLGDTKSSLGDAQSSLGDAKSSLGGAVLDQLGRVVRARRGEGRGVRTHSPSLSFIAWLSTCSMARMTIPRADASCAPRLPSVCVLPVPVCPYAITVPLYPLMQLCARPTHHPGLRWMRRVRDSHAADTWQEKPKS